MKLAAFFLGMLACFTGAKAVEDFPYDGSLTVSSNPQSTFYWKLVEDGGVCKVSLRLYTLSNVWVSFGPGTRMSNGMVFIASNYKNGLSEYKMTGTTESSITSYSNANNVAASYDVSGNTVDVRVHNITSIAGKTLSIPCPGADASLSESFVFAFGPDNTAFKEHTKDYTLSIPWSTSPSSMLSASVLQMFTVVFCFLSLINA